MIYHSIKYIETRRIESFEGHIPGEFGEVQSGPYIWEKVGRDCFATLGEAKVAGANKLRRAIAATEAKLERLRGRLEDLERVGLGVIEDRPVSAEAVR